jgi:hypothetical protein
MQKLCELKIIMDYQNKTKLSEIIWLHTKNFLKRKLMLKILQLTLQNDKTMRMEKIVKILYLKKNKFHKILQLMPQNDRHEAKNERMMKIDYWMI